MLCLLSLPPSGPYGSQRTTWPHRITCKYLLYTSDSTRASRTCRHAAALGHRQTKSHNCNVLDVSCAHFLRLYSITIMTSKWPVTLAARPTDISVYIQPCFPEEGGTQRILSSHSCRLQGFFRCHSPDVLQNTCLFAVHRAYGLTALQTHTHTHTPCTFLLLPTTKLHLQPFWALPASWVKLLSWRWCQLPTCLDLMALLTHS